MAKFVDLESDAAIELAPDLEEPLLNAYYTELVKAPATARETAQRAFAVVTAITAALVAAAALVNLPQRSVAVLALGLLSLIGWVVSALLFMQAMGSRAFAKSPDVVEKSQWSALAINEVITSRNKLYGWLLAARVGTLIAAVLTVVTLTIGVAEARNASMARLRTLLTPEGQRELSIVCPALAQGLGATVDLSSLDSRFVTLTADAGQCGRKSAKIRLPGTSVAAFVPLTPLPIPHIPQRCLRASYLQPMVLSYTTSNFTSLSAQCLRWRPTP